jgi:hypothetical protein
MLQQAKAITTHDSALDEANNEDASQSTMIVWEGFLTRFITEEMHLSIPYYSSVTLALKRMGCIRQLRRGGGSSPSQWELIREPTEERFNDTEPKKVAKVTKLTMLQEQINAQEVRIKALEDILETIIREAEGEVNGRV